MGEWAAVNVRVVVGSDHCCSSSWILTYFLPKLLAHICRCSSQYFSPYWIFLAIGTALCYGGRLSHFAEYWHIWYCSLLLVHICCSGQLYFAYFLSNSLLPLIFASVIIAFVCMQFWPELGYNLLVSSEIGENRGCILPFHMHPAEISLQFDTNTNTNTNDT